jgi:L,D-peptidoglycan transpeptidase YkuD (ErfK/YbiS/YcfS/YnhG family)
MHERDRLASQRSHLCDIASLRCASMGVGRRGQGGERGGRRLPHLVRVLTAVVVLVTAMSFPGAQPEAAAASFRIPSATRQLIVGVATDWDANTVELGRFERRKGGAWQRVGQTWPGRLGRAGLAWGRGLAPATPPENVTMKVEGDLRSPAGVFTLGAAYGYAPDVDRNLKQPYVRVTSRDLFVEDPASPLYNTHVRLDREPQTAWEKDQRMELSDPAHSLQLFIGHNAPPDVAAGAGSAILFHNWRRNGDATTAGCTAMAPSWMSEIVRWIDPAKAPLYVLLPREYYASVASTWRLPPLTT